MAKAPPPMRRGKRQTPESRVTLEIRRYLVGLGYVQLTRESLSGALLILSCDSKAPGVFWRNSVGAAPNPAGRLYRYGIPGMPDLWLIKRTRHHSSTGWEGEMIAIEIKQPGGRLSPHQSRIRRILELCGTTYILATGPESLADAGIAV